MCGAARLSMGPGVKGVPGGLYGEQQSNIFNNI